MKTGAQPIRIFIAYSHKDYPFLEEMRIAAVPLERSGKVKIWYDGKIEAGTVWDSEIKTNLHAADIILLLVSSSSLASDYFYEREVADALERHRRGQTRVIPVILSHCFWDETPLSELQAVPAGARPVNTWPDRHEAWHNVLSRIRDAIREIQESRADAVRAPLTASPGPSQERPEDIQYSTPASQPAPPKPHKQTPPVKNKVNARKGTQNTANSARKKSVAAWKASLLSKSKKARTIEFTTVGQSSVLEISITEALISVVHIKLNDELVVKKAMNVFGEYFSGEFQHRFSLAIGDTRYPANIRLSFSLWSGAITGLELSIEDVIVYSE